MSDYLAAQFLAHDTPASLAIGQTVTVNLRVKNVGTRVWRQAGTDGIHVGFKWLNASGETQPDVDNRRTALPCDVAAGQEVAFGAILAAPKTPGTYRVHWDLVAMGKGWFADGGSQPLVVPVALIAKPSDVTGWRVESPLNPHGVTHALDGDPNTFWDSRAPQAPGQWFRLNLAAPRWVDGIQFLSPGKGFPVSYLLRVSADGTTWVELAHVTSEHPHDVMAVFAPQFLQYAQLDLLDAGATNWMISEILLHPAVVWSANASHNARMAAQAIDNRLDTCWSSGVPQSPGMWLQIDLGRSEAVSGLSLVAPRNENPVGWRAAIWNAQANRWQIVGEKTENSAPVDVSFPTVQTQFINIQLLQSSESVWAIREARVVREMDAWLRPTM